MSENQETPEENPESPQKEAEAEKGHVSRGKTSKHSILVPVDFSTHSEAALIHGCTLAHCTGSPVLVLHVVHDPGAMPGYYSKMAKKKTLSRMEDLAAEMLQEFLHGARKSHPGIKELKKAEQRLVSGLPVSRILEVAEKVGAQAIVMGSKGQTGLKHLLMGSIAESVVQLSPIPVTIVKSKPKK